MQRRSFRSVFIVTTLSVMVLHGPASAAGPGDPDRSFGGGDGRVFVRADGRTRVLALFEDGSGRLTLAAAIGDPLRRGQALIARRLADGSPDPAYVGGGHRVLDPTPGEDELFAAARTPSGGMVLLARSGRDGRFSLTRVGPDGRPDRTFGGDGTIVDRFGSRLFWGSLAVRPDGRILVAGITLAGARTPMRRYRTDGTLDASFAERGRLSVQGVQVESILLRADGRFVVVGPDSGVPGGPFVAARQYSAGGDADPDFGDDGLATLLVDPRTPSVIGIGRASLDHAGRLIVPGVLYDPQRDRSDAMVAVMNRDGSTHRAFSGNGWTRLDLGRSDAFNAAIRLPDGRILVVGGTADALQRDWMDTPGAVLAAVYRADGTPDPSFGDAGIALTRIDRPGGHALATTLLTAGTTYTIGGTGGGSGLVARFFLLPR